MAAIAAALVLTWNARRRDIAVSRQEKTLYLIVAVIFAAATIYALASGDVLNVLLGVGATLAAVVPVITKKNDKRQ